MFNYITLKYPEIWWRGSMMLLFLELSVVEWYCDFLTKVNACNKIETGKDTTAREYLWKSFVVFYKPKVNKTLQALKISRPDHKLLHWTVALFGQYALFRAPEAWGLQSMCGRAHSFPQSHRSLHQRQKSWGRDAFLMCIWELHKHSDFPPEIPKGKKNQDQQNVSDTDGGTYTRGEHSITHTNVPSWHGAPEPGTNWHWCQWYFSF